MADVALSAPETPKFNALALLKSPRVGLGVALFVFIAAAAILFKLFGPIELPASGHKLPLQPALHAAPAGWVQSLKAHHGAAAVSSDVVQLSERPLAGAAAPGAAKTMAPIAVAGGQLPAAPIAGFFAPGPSGPLPIIASDGRTPAQVYARPFHSNGRPKLALVIGGLGLNARATRQAIETLPPDVTLSFSIYAEGLQGWIDLARAHGHEALIEAPMEPLDYPDNDPGAWTLMADGQPPETVKKLEWILSRATGYFGLANYQGARFLASDAAYGALASSLRARGLAFIDDGAAARRAGGVPRATAERVIDDKLSGPAIDQQLLALEAGALQRGQALGTGFAYPITLEKVARWTVEVQQRGYQLAPASALMAKR